jgi:hypothetical protein
MLPAIKRCPAETDEPHSMNTIKGKNYLKLNSQTQPLLFIHLNAEIGFLTERQKKEVKKLA